MHSALIGLLYGFGRANAHLYYKIDQLRGEIQKWLLPPFNFLAQDFSAPPEFQVLQNEYAESLGRLKPFPPEEDPLCLSTLTAFPLPCFGADLTHPETEQIMEYYTKVRQEVVHAYSQGDFLEVTLCKFTE